MARAHLWQETKPMARDPELRTYADDQHAEFLDADSSAVLYLSLSLGEETLGDPTGFPRSIPNPVQ